MRNKDCKNFELDKFLGVERKEGTRPRKKNGSSIGKLWGIFQIDKKGCRLIKLLIPVHILVL